MFTRRGLLIQWALASRVQNVCRLWTKSTQQHQTVYRCYSYFRHRNVIIQCAFPRKSGQLTLGFGRSVYSVQLGREHHYVSNKASKLIGSLRSLSSESDLSEKSSDQADLVVEDSTEDVVKELDAEGIARRKSRKERSSLDNASVKGYSLKSVGKLVPDKVVNLLGEDGESLGSLHRTEAIKRSQETGLKLVLVNPKSQPYPTYRLMTGQQLHQEQMRLREKLKARSAPTQVKEVRLSGNIEKHDLEVKRRHLHDWFKEGGAQVHVRVTVMGGGKKKVTKEQQMAVINGLMSGLEDRVTFIGKPRDIGKDGMNLMVVLRPMLAKEKAALVRQRNKEESLKQQAAEKPRQESDDRDENNSVRDEKVDT